VPPPQTSFGSNERPLSHQLPVNVDLLANHALNKDRLNITDWDPVSAAICSRLTFRAVSPHGKLPPFSTGHAAGLPMTSFAPFSAFTAILLVTWHHSTPA